MYVLLFWHIHAKTPRGIVVCEQLQNYLIYSVNVTIMRKTYLKEHRPAIYSLYILEDRLVEHLNAVDDEAQERMDILVCQMMKRQGITEETKACDQMAWVGTVNNIRNAAEEIVLKELIYR